VQEIDQTEVRVPVAHKVDKTPVLIFIKNKRYFPVTQMEKDGTPGERGLDESICTVGLLLGGFGYISLNEGVSGQLIRGRAPVDGYFKTMMSVLNKNKEMLKFFVYEDSFEEFNLLKRHIVSEGINYMWIPMENSEERLFFSTQGGGGGTGGVQVF